MSLDVRCAGCESYFPLSRVVQEGNGYYCKKCLKKHREELHREAGHEANCIFCNKVLHDGDRKTLGGYLYCTECSEKIAGNPKTGDAYKCSICGELLSAYDPRMIRGGKDYCEKCYREAFDEAGKEKTYKCSVCGREMRRLEVRMRQGQNYCSECHRDIENARESTIKKILREKATVGPEDLENGPATKKAPGTDEKAYAETAYAETARLFRCLGDPCRVKIIESLADHDLSVFAFVEITGFGYSAISYHLKMLKDMGLVDSARNGNFQVYSLTGKGAAVHEFIRKSAGLK